MAADEVSKPRQGHKMDNLSRIPSASCAKVFVQRDYLDGTGVKFQNKFPLELEGKVDRGSFEQTINSLNTMYAEAESLGGRTYCESCFACLTAYLAYLCIDTYYEKCLKKIKRYIETQNESVYVPRGLMLVDPVERGLRVLEICVLSENNHR
ncbi:golgin subfamily A member 7-like isoform X1 [Haliotis asinina]|uniref:golgin subfamily A member 7-like isoform X1 n=1 Tax=Haliotis asinina TaxID=109174 RepID=UPI0035320C4B